VLPLVVPPAVEPPAVVPDVVPIVVPPAVVPLVVPEVIVPEVMVPEVIVPEVVPAVEPPVVERPVVAPPDLLPPAVVPDVPPPVVPWSLVLDEEDRATLVEATNAATKVALSRNEDFFIAQKEKRVGKLLEKCGSKERASSLFKDADPWWSQACFPSQPWNRHWRRCQYSTRHGRSRNRFRQPWNYPPWTWYYQRRRQPSQGPCRNRR
jgi:hypothetical protein